MKRTFTVSTCIGDGIEASVTFDYYPGSPGRYSGPPERCYEDEPDEFEVTRVVVGGVDMKLSQIDLEELMSRIERQAKEDAKLERFA